MTEVSELLQATIAAHVAPDARVLEARQREGGEQGFSAAMLRYYDVTYTRAGVTERITLVTKEAPLGERHSRLSGAGTDLDHALSCGQVAE